MEILSPRALPFCIDRCSRSNLKSIKHASAKNKNRIYQHRFITQFPYATDDTKLKLLISPCIILRFFHLLPLTIYPSYSRSRLKFIKSKFTLNVNLVCGALYLRKKISFRCSSTSEIYYCCNYSVVKKRNVGPDINNTW